MHNYIWVAQVGACYKSVTSTRAAPNQSHPLLHSLWLISPSLPLPALDLMFVSLFISTAHAFSPYKDSVCPTLSRCDGLHSRLLWERVRGDGGKKRGKERVRERKRRGAVQQWRTWQLSAGQKDCAEHLLLSPTPLQPPHYLSIYHKAARSNVCSSQDWHREGGAGMRSKRKKDGKERDRLHVTRSTKWRGSKWSSCVCIAR